MKRKIFIGLAIASVLFTVAGTYVIFMVERTTAKLDKLIQLHQVEILREHLLLHVKGVQSGLTLTGTRYAIGVDPIVSRTIQMSKVANECFRCHHSPSVTESLRDLKAQTEEYKSALSRVLTLSANEARLEAEKDRTIRIGEKLIGTINGVIAMTTVKLKTTTETAFSEIAATKAMLFVLIATGPLFLLLFGVISVRAWARPLTELLTATRRIKAGHLDHRIQGLKDEFGELAVSFNEMAASLNEQMLKMQRTEQMVVVAQLAAALGHEVKNPLAGIKAAINLLSEELELEGADRALFRQIVEQVGRLESLMKNFVNFAKPPKPQWATVDVNDLVETTLDFYMKSGRPNSEETQTLRIEKEMGGAVPSITADPIQLQQVLLNLILNAVDAMQGQGTLAVRTRYDDASGAVHIEVRDTGPGIDPATASKLFQPFFTTKPKGTGLGLATCKQLIEQHGGSLHAENQPSGGAAFRIVFHHHEDSGETGAP